MPAAKHLIRAASIAFALALALGAMPGRAAESPNRCARASLTNPDAGAAAAASSTAAGAGGMGGTGSVAGAGGIGGTGSVAGTGGMGGTGIMADVVPGTGGMGGTGIVGVITGFASICVNGVEVHYDARTPVSVNGQPGAPRDLAVGQVVAVNARTVAGRLQADGIGVVDAVAGPVTRINPATRELQVMGQTVRTDTATGTTLSNLRVGDVARVSGHRSDSGDIIATRIDTPARGTGTFESSLLGTVSRVEGSTLIVNGSRVTTGARGTQGITAGSEVFVSGDWNGTALQARRVDAQPVRNAIARSERAIIEGYVRGKTAQTLNVGGITVRIDDRVRYNGGNDRDAEVGRKVQVEVRRNGDDWRAERVRLQRDDRSSRRDDDGTSNRTDSRDAERSDSRESDRSDSRDSGRSESRDSSRSESRESGRSESRESGRSDSRDASRSESRDPSRNESGSRRNSRH